MAWRPHGHVKVNARSPAAAGICDRCGRAFNHRDLAFQFDWSGTRIQNLRILVCPSCYDVPQEQLRARILSPDPLPIFNARPEPFTTTGISYEESNLVFCADGVTQIVCADGVTGLLCSNNPDVG